MMIALLLLCCLSAPAEVHVDVDTLTLGDLIAFPAGDVRNTLPLGYAPNPGLGRRFLRQELMGKLNASGMKTDDLQLPDSILVRRMAQTLNPEVVSKAIADAFARQFPDAVTTIVSVDTPNVQVATGDLELVATLPARVNSGAPVFARLEVRGAGSARSLFVRTIAEIQRPQPVLQVAVPAHAPIREEDVSFELGPVRGTGTPITSTAALSGFVAKRELQPGQVLTEDLLYRPVLVRRGETVTVKATIGTVAVAATMRAKAAGHYGDVIALEHLSGSGTTSARVTGPGVLEVTEGAK